MGSNIPEELHDDEHANLVALVWIEPKVSMVTLIVLPIVYVLYRKVPLIFRTLLIYTGRGG